MQEKMGLVLDCGWGLW